VWLIRPIDVTHPAAFYGARSRAPGAEPARQARALADRHATGLIISGSRGRAEQSSCGASQPLGAQVFEDRPSSRWPAAKSLARSASHDRLRLPRHDEGIPWRSVMSVTPTL